MANEEMATTTANDKPEAEEAPAVERLQSDTETTPPATGYAGADETPNEDAELRSHCDAALFSESGSAYVAKITVGKRRRALDPAKVDELVASIREVGLLEPIIVTPIGPVQRRFKGRKIAYFSQLRLVAGWHRLEAAKKLGWRAIPATVIQPGHPLQCDLIEIDENLIRVELTELERGEHLADRKAIYEQLHPETKAGTAQALGMNQALGNDVGDNLAPTFTQDTAAKTGLSQRTIERAVHRAENIAPEIRDEIREMPKIADSGVELDALAKVPQEEQLAVVKAVKAGEAKTVREAARGPRPTPIPKAAPAPRSKSSAIIGTAREQWIEMTAAAYRAPASALYAALMDTARLINEARTSTRSRARSGRRFCASSTPL